MYERASDTQSWNASAALCPPPARETTPQPPPPHRRCVRVKTMRRRIFENDKKWWKIQMNYASSRTDGWASLPNPGQLGNAPAIKIDYRSHTGWPAGPRALTTTAEPLSYIVKLTYNGRGHGRCDRNFALRLRRRTTTVVCGHC